MLGSAAEAWPGGWGLARAMAGQRGNALHGAQGYFGIDVRDVSEEQVSVLRLKDARGAEIIRVDHDGPAGKMGLREHDVVLQMNGIAIEGEEQIRRLLHEIVPGRMVALTVSRDGLAMTMTVPMGDRSQVEKQAWEQHLAPPPAPQAPTSALPSGEAFVPGPAFANGPAPSSHYGKSFLGTLLMSSSYTGAMLEMMGPQLAEFFGVPGGVGLLVRSVAPNSPAATAGMHAGDVVIRANAETVTSTNEWAKMIKEAKGRPVTVVVLRDRQEKTLTLKPDGKRRSCLGTPRETTDALQMSRLTEL